MYSFTGSALKTPVLLFQKHFQTKKRYLMKLLANSITRALCKL